MNLSLCLKVATAQFEGMVEVEVAIIAASTSTLPEHKTLKTAWHSED